LIKVSFKKDQIFLDYWGLDSSIKNLLSCDSSMQCLEDLII
jgi:hypothetical protein